jgi:spore coat polysaccharide biosynthesis protein SpsF
MASTRLPGKVLKKVKGKSIFAHHVERMREVEGLSGRFLATSKDPANKQLIKEAERLGCGWYAGEEQDVVDRHIELCKREKADAVIRVTCDCPIFDPESASCFVEKFRKKYKDYIYVTNMTIACGTLSELISFRALLEIHKHYRGPAISLYIKENMASFDTLGVEIALNLCRPEYRLTVDESDDLELVRRIYTALYKGKPIKLKDVYVWLDDNPEIAKLNSHVIMKGINQHSANLLERPAYSIVISGVKYVILDSKKRTVKPEKFIKEFIKLFPELKQKYARTYLNIR